MHENIDCVVSDYVYWKCDKEICQAKNYRVIFRLPSGRFAFPEEYNDDICSSCNQKIHEPLFIEIDPFKKND